MPLIRSLVSKCLTYYFKLVAIILLLSEIMPTYFCYTEKGSVYIIIIALLGCQPYFYAKCIKLNICFFCNVRSVSNTKCIFLTRFYTL